MNVRAERFPLFDSMRAIAFLSVFVAHASFFAGLAVPGHLLRPYVSRLDVGVRIFFLISAFLLYRPFVAAQLTDADPPRVRAYAWRRFLRITPPYWAALTLIGLWIGSGGLFVLSHAPLYYGFAHIYAPATYAGGPLPQAWTLCVEAAFYVFLPLYAAGMRSLPRSRPDARLRRELIGAAVLFVLSLAYKLVLASQGSVQSLLIWHVAPLEYLDYFAIGMALAALSVWYRGRSQLPVALRAIDRWPILPWLGAAAAFVLVSKGIGLTPAHAIAGKLTNARHLERHYLYAAIAFGVILPAIFGDPAHGLVRRLLGWRPLLWVGMVSYGAFLVHFAVLVQLQRWSFGSWASHTWRYLWFPVALAGVLAIAALSWYFFERPILSLKRLVSIRAVERGEATLEPAPAVPPEVAAR